MLRMSLLLAAAAGVLLLTNCTSDTNGHQPTATQLQTRAAINSQTIQSASSAIISPKADSSHEQCATEEATLASLRTLSTSSNKYDQAAATKLTAARQNLSLVSKIDDAASPLATRIIGELVDLQRIAEGRSTIDPSQLIATYIADVQQFEAYVQSACS